MYNVFLPKTNFNIYEKDFEDRIIDFWDNINLNKKRDSMHMDATPFVLHDGPPYANGPIHMGHAENKIWKDSLNRIFWMHGYSTPYVLGWDAHGLPIENAVEKKLKADGIDKNDLSKQDFWDKCLEFASYWIEEQKKGFKKLGVLGDYDNPYVTFHEEESIGIIDCIHSFVSSNYVVKKYRPVLWSYVEKTALAYAEVEYKEKASNSIYFSFPIVKSNDEVLKGVNVLVWTTTPWTLPANEAVAYNKNFQYIIFLVNDKKYCCEVRLFEEIKNLFSEVNVWKSVEGSVFEGAIVEHCIEEFNTENKVRRMIHGDHVDHEKGTGFVHTAPAHGEEDFDLGVKEHLNIEDLLDENGAFKSTVPLVAGVHVKQADKLMVDLLQERSLCLAHEEFKHSYPHSWRSKAPLIYRLTKQWFLNMAPLREKALEVANDPKLNWFPEEGKNRFISMLSNRDDWCISRQRIWGIPLSIFYNKENDFVLRDAEFLLKTRKHLEKIGVKNWSSVKISDIDDSYNDEEWQRVDDIVDIWFESGSTQSFVLKKKNLYPADVYLEGSDQHRGWFQSSLLVAANLNGSAPWKNLVTHGFCLDGSKQKMSKSLGNVISPLSWDIDTLRVFFSSLNLAGDISISENSIKHAQEMVFRFKNTIKFLLGNLSISKEIKSVPYEELPALEKWILHKVYKLDQSFTEITKSFYLNNFINNLYEFCSQDLSSFYFDVRKDTLYCEEFNNYDRRAVISLFRLLTPILLKYLSVFMPYSMENAWETYNNENDLSINNKESIHLQEKETIPEYYFNENSNNYIEKLRDIKKKVNEQIEPLREQKLITTSHEVKVVITDTNIDLTELKQILIVSEVVYGEAFQVEIIKGLKCKRCKFLFNSLDENLCKRCFSVLDN
ncbi:isoleucine--tRNA ligase [Alphaproteobacteria bacterium endosymbiont of Tiliacea citrago]|uniref:isoleucine--tRNA ligase n=1 Tax=Alphaproteobacteria bacterium endosymbiont of Tiliacea citrago TaxID=3077944 RepID=UPI00313AA763